MLLGALRASLFGNMLAGKGVIRTGEGTTRVDYGSKRSLLKTFFDSPTSFNKRIIKMNLDLMGSILETIYLIK